MIGIENEPGLWMADLEAGTVTAVDSPSSGDLRKDSEVVTRGISFAAYAQTAEPLSGGDVDK